MWREGVRVGVCWKEDEREGWMYVDGRARGREGWYKCTDGEMDGCVSAEGKVRREEGQGHG